MNLPYQPVLETEPKKEDLDLLKRGIDEYNVFITGESTGNRDITFFIRNAENDIIGGVRGTYNTSGWLYIIGIWVAKEYRSRGYGTLLIKSIETEARKNGCTNSYLNTISFQAPEFYKKLGYTIFGELEKFHQNYSRYFFRKEI